MRTQPLDPERLEHCACLSVRRAARLVTRAFDDALADSGLAATQFTVLAALAGEPRTIGALASHLAMDRTTVTRNIGPLARDGLIRIRTGPDARRRIVKLTPSGRRKVKEAFPLWRKAQRHTVAAMGRGNFVRLLGGLAGMADALPRTH